MRSHQPTARILLALFAILSITAAAQTNTPLLRPRVVIVAYFEVGADTGDRPGELQFWVDRDHLTRSINVPGMSRAVRANPDATEVAITIGPGNINPAVNLMAFAADPRFDLRHSYWLINGIAGIAPADGTIGSAVWTDFVIDGDLAKEIDPREIPPTWPDGFLSLDGATQSDPKSPAWEEDVRTWQTRYGDQAHANRRGNVIRLNLALMRWAYNLTRDTPLPEDAPMKTLRLSFPTSPAPPPAPASRPEPTSPPKSSGQAPKWTPGPTAG